MTAKTGRQLVDEARARIREVTTEQALEMRARGDHVVFLDVRERNEWNLGRLPGAMHIARGSLETKVEAAIPRDKRIVVYCASGNRSALAADTMREMGYTDVASLAGGFMRWAQSGGEVEG